MESHLAELRKRILRVAICIMAITVFAMTFHLEPIWIWGVPMYYPIPDPLHNMAAQITVHMANDLVPEGVDVIQTAPGQAFFSQVYIAALLALVLSIPLMVREGVNFVGPALRRTEIRTGRSITLPAMALFAAGCIFSYIVVVPYVIDILYLFGESADLITFLNIMDFVAFVLQFLLAFGISFQLPMIMYAVTYSGATNPRFWRHNIRYAVVIIVIFGAVITPDGSGITMWFVAGPMIALYLMGMLIIEKKITV